MLLAQALSLHQSGRRAEAEAAYRALLAAGPGNAQALHAYGVLRHQSGDSEAAVELIDLRNEKTPLGGLSEPLRQAMIDAEETALRKRVLYCILYYVLLSYILLFYDMILRKSTTRRAPCESRTICIILF